MGDSRILEPDDWTSEEGQPLDFEEPGVSRTETRYVKGVLSSGTSPLMRDKDLTSADVARRREGDFVRQQMRIDAASRGVDFLARQTRELAAAVEQVPPGATHRIIGGDFPGQYVAYYPQPGDKQPVMVTLVGGNRAERRMLVYSANLAKVGEDFPDRNLPKDVASSSSGRVGVPHLGRGKGSAPIRG